MITLEREVQPVFLTSDKQQSKGDSLIPHTTLILIFLMRSHDLTHHADSMHNITQDNTTNLLIHNYRGLQLKLLIVHDTQISPSQMRCESS